MNNDKDAMTSVQGWVFTGQARASGEKKTGNDHMEMGILTRDLADKHRGLIDYGLIIFDTDLIAGNFMGRRLTAPSDFGKITLIKIRMNGIR